MGPDWKVLPMMRVCWSRPAPTRADAALLILDVKTLKVGAQLAPTFKTYPKILEDVSPGVVCRAWQSGFRLCRKGRLLRRAKNALLAMTVPGFFG
jgi:hypothetical protein